MCSSAELKESVDNNLFIQLNQEKFNIILRYQKFNNQCNEVNMLLAKHGYFLRVFELKNKFHHLALKNQKKQNIVRKLSSCINEKYNGFQVISIEYSKKLQKKKLSVTTLKIYQNHTEILAETPKNYRTRLPLSVIIVKGFLQELTNKKNTLKVVLVFPV